MNTILRSIPAAAAVLVMSAARAQSAADMNASNNPLTPNIGVNLQDQYVGRYYGLSGEGGNAVLLRGTLPHNLFATPQILRVTMPVVTTPDLPPSGRQTGAGDLNLFNLFLLKVGAVEVGIGPQLTMPTASRDETGTGKWQAGLASAVVAPQRWGLLGGLVTWQRSFAGHDDREGTDTLQLQPFFIYNLPHAWYLRSSATTSFDLRNGNYYLPLGLGVGRIWKDGATTFNLFTEPQWTISHDGAGVPKFQVFFGLNLQFPR